MPVWVLAYFTVYVAFAIWSITHDIKNNKEPFFFSAAEIGGDICLLTAAISFWSGSVRDSLASVGMLVYAVGFALFLAHAGRSFRCQVVIDRELSWQGKLFVGFIGSVLILAFHAPVIFWGFKSTVLGDYAGT